MSSSSDCHTCGTAIPEADLAEGKALSLLGRNYCASCRGHAVKEISLDDLVAHPPKPSDPTQAFSSTRLAEKKKKPASVHLPPAPPAPLPSPPKAASPRAASPKPPAAAPKSAAPRARLFSRRKGPSRTPVYVIAALGTFSIVLVALVLLASPGDKDPEIPSPDPEPEAVEKPAPVDRARQAYDKAKAIARRSDVEFDLILAELDAARAACRGSEWESKVKELRERVLADRETEKSTRALKTMLDGLRRDTVADVELKRYAELTAQFEKARGLAAKGRPSAIQEIQDVQGAYKKRYEAAAQPHFDRIMVAAKVLARERRYDDALSYIESFPHHLRESGAWKGLEALRLEVVRGKRSSRKRK